MPQPRLMHAERGPDSSDIIGPRELLAWVNEMQSAKHCTKFDDLRDGVAYCCLFLKIFPASRKSKYKPSPRLAAANFEWLQAMCTELGLQCVDHVGEESPLHFTLPPSFPVVHPGTGEGQPQGDLQLPGHAVLLAEPRSQPGRLGQLLLRQSSLYCSSSPRFPFPHLYAGLHGLVRLRGRCAPLGFSSVHAVARGARACGVCLCTRVQQATGKAGRQLECARVSAPHTNSLDPYLDWVGRTYSSLARHSSSAARPLYSTTSSPARPPPSSVFAPVAGPLETPQSSPLQPLAGSALSPPASSSPSVSAPSPPPRAAGATHTPRAHPQPRNGHPPPVGASPASSFTSAPPPNAVVSRRAAALMGTGHPSGDGSGAGDESMFAPPGPPAVATGAPRPPQPDGAFASPPPGVGGPAGEGGGGEEEGDGADDERRGPRGWSRQEEGMTADDEVAALHTCLLLSLLPPSLHGPPRAPLTFAPERPCHYTRGTQQFSSNSGHGIMGLARATRHRLARQLPACTGGCSPMPCSFPNVRVWMGPQQPVCSPYRHLARRRLWGARFTRPTSPAPHSRRHHCRPPP